MNHPTPAPPVHPRERLPTPPPASPLRRTALGNPFRSPLALANSEYYRPENERLVLDADPGQPPSAFAEEAHRAFREFILAAGYSCVDAKAAINRQVYRLAVYDELASRDATAGLSRDLATFVAEQAAIDNDHSTFVAIFAGPQDLFEEEFEHRFWQQLRRLNREDASAGFAWDPTFLLTPCSPETFTIIYKDPRYHPSCFENLWRNLAPFGITPDEIPTTLNIFMNVDIAPGNGELTIGPPRSRAGDFLELRAEMDLFAGLTACSAEMSNNGRFKPIEYEIYADAPV